MADAGRRQQRAEPRFLRNREGGVLIIGALALPVMIGVSALVAEYGHALLTRIEHQRVADLSSYAGALAYARNRSEDEMRAAVEYVAGLNNVAPGALIATIIDSPRNPGAEAVSVTVRTQKNLLLAPVLGAGSVLEISAAAVAQVGAPKAPAVGCIIALTPGASGITLSGGTSLQADECEVSSNSTVTVPCGTTIRTQKLNYDSATVPSQPCQGIVRPGGGAAQINRAFTADPLADHPGVALASSRLTDVAALAGPSAPTVASGTNIEFGWNATATQNAASAVGCSASFASPTWTFTCPTNVKTVNLGNLTMGGGINLNFALSGAADVTYNFSGRISTAGIVRFGPGSYNIAQGIATGGGSTTDFGAGTFRIGRMTSNCSAQGGNALYSICNTATLRFSGPSVFEIHSGMSNAGGATLTLGAGTTNSFRIGPSSNGNAIALGGGSITVLADALGVGNKFEIVGTVQGGGGGSCFAVSDAPHHDIAGGWNASGAIILGTGVYSVDGYFHLGNSGGGSVNCNGQVVSVKAEGVTVVISGKSIPNSGTCAGRAFCVTAGYSNIHFKAPNEGSYQHLAVVGPLSSAVTAGALFAGGAGGSQVSGGFYFPNGPVVMNGGASAAAVPEGCLTLIGTFITLAGGTSAVSQCDGLRLDGADDAPRVSLIQ